VYRAAWSHYDDRADGRFDRYEGEAATFVPFPAPHLVLAVRGWFVATSQMDGRRVPLYLQPALGGANTLRGYPDYRFHDRHLAVVNAEGRFALFAHVDAAVFADAGGVSPRIGDLALDHRSYGGGVRLHTGTATVARFDVARGSEGWRVVFRTSDPLRLSRIARRTAAAPFVP
jgi:outer membrane protein assembly factor BamA